MWYQDFLKDGKRKSNICNFWKITEFIKYSHIPKSDMIINALENLSRNPEE